MLPIDALGQLGFPVARIGLTAAVRRFQAGYAIGTPLVVDGKAGPLTRAALDQSAASGLASPHFAWAELGCHCRGSFGCDVLWPQRELLVGLERLRATAYPSGLSLRSVCRCERQNAKVGGAPDSEHLRGRAADVPPVMTPDIVKRIPVFRGIGFSKSSGRVVHVDVRPKAVPPFVDGP